MLFGPRDDVAFMPEIEAATRHSVSRYAVMLSLLLVTFLGVFVIWADRAVLDEVTRGDGQVVPSQKIQVVQNLEGGIVAEILVHEGDIVDKGDVLLRIENVQAESAYRDVRARYVALLASVTRLRAEIEGTELVMPAEVVAEQPQVAAEQQALFNARQEELRQQVGVLKTQAEQRRQEIDQLAAKKRHLERSLAITRNLVNMTRPLAEQGVTPQVDFLRLQRELAQMEGELENVTTSIPRAESALREAQERVQAQYAAFRSEALGKLNEQLAEMQSLKANQAAGKDRVVRTEVRSPVRGTVKELKQNTVGGVIRPGEDIAEIVPLDDSLLVEARIRPADIAFLHPKQDAVVKITAYDFSVYGGLPAVIEHISADTLKNEEGEHYYRVLLRTRTNTLAHRGEHLPIIPGMTASVDILTGKKTVLDYLLKPILKARERALRER